jgi:hypothetical protein
LLINAMHAFQVAKREHSENVKAQYTDKKGGDGAVTWFRASGLGEDDRKAIYRFFAHQLPTQSKSAQNLRQLENGDKVHERYQDAWEDMGILISMEDRLSSKNDEYLKQFEWELAGHYDGLLDVNVIRAHALGLTKLNSVFNEETESWELEVELDEAYANSIGIYEEGYEPPVMVADIKTINPWGFKAIKEKGDISNVQSYIDQIMFYMYMLNTPYGSLYFEAKDNNDDCEVQVLWRDLHDSEEEPFLYEWDDTIHGEQENGKVRVVVTSERFYGSDTQEGVVGRNERLWNIRKQLIEADAAGDMETIRNIMPVRCAETPDKFPCSWGHKTGKPSYCEFYDHCWSKQHGGNAVRPYEAVPAEAIWEFEEEDGTIIKVDNRKVPEGIDEDTFASLIGMGALKLELFLIDSTEGNLETDGFEESDYEESPEGFNEDNLFGTDGSLVVSTPAARGEMPSEALEYTTEDGKKAIDCLNCGRQIQYQKLANGGTKKCPHCKHTQQVVRA